MIGSVRRWLRARRESPPIPQALWARTLERYPFIACRSAADRQTLARLCSEFLRTKEFAGLAGFEVTDEVAVAIAAQACLPVLGLGLRWYAGFVGINVYPDEMRARREQQDEAGVVHEYDEFLTGEALAGGPVTLSWADVANAGATAEWGYNVVIHEFAHVIDMADGVADGTPPLPTAAARRRWQRVLLDAQAVFRDRVDQGESTALDPYGADSEVEFFAVATEAFFVTPRAMLDEHPALYAEFREFYRQDPAAGAPALAPSTPRA